MAEFEKDIEKYIEDLQNERLLYEDEEEFVENISTKETALEKQAKPEIKKSVDLTKEEIKQIKKEAKFFKKDNDLLSYSGIKDLDLDDLTWDEDEEE
ncbi:Uncharacterised protein [Mesomycoplasma hyorhinis]|nr:Uncharacterised protein [Mesomycoplasma hyorhinis]